MTKLNLYRRIGFASALGLAGWMTNSASAQQSYYQGAESPRVTAGPALPEPISTPAALPGGPMSGGAVMGGGVPCDAVGDCRGDPYISVPCPHAHGGAANCEDYSFDHQWHCHCLPALQETHWGYPEEFIKRPLGSQMYRILGTQVANGQIARMMLYRYDFQGGELSIYGRRRALKLVDCMRMVASPLAIEATGDEALDQYRRESVIAFLQQFSSFPIVPESVVIGDPLVRPLNGPDAVLIQVNLLKQVTNGGPSYSSSGSTGQNNNAIGTQQVSPGSYGTGQ